MSEPPISWCISTHRCVFNPFLTRTHICVFTFSVRDGKFSTATRIYLAFSKFVSSPKLGWTYTRMLLIAHWFGLQTVFPPYKIPSYMTKDLYKPLPLSNLRQDACWIRNLRRKLCFASFALQLLNGVRDGISLFTHRPFHNVFFLSTLMLVIIGVMTSVWLSRMSALVCYCFMCARSSKSAEIGAV